MTEYLTIKQTAKLLGRNAGAVRRRCAAGRFVGAKKEAGKWLIPETCHEKLRQPDHLIGSEDLSALSEKKRRAALTKLGIINIFEGFAAKFVADNGFRRQAVFIFASQNKIGFGTLYRWLRAYRKFGLMGLVDSRGSADTAQAVFSPEAATRLLTMYLTTAKLSLKTCYQNILFINKNENKGWKIPALRTVHKWVEDNVPKPVRILQREGQKAYDAQCAPYIQKDLSDVAPGAIWVGDHHQFDFWIRHKNSWVRPWITAWMDMKSRCLVGWHLSACPNQTTVLISMRVGIEKYGPPDAVKIDNGKDYDSQMFTGITKKTRKAGYLDEFLVSGIYGMMNISVSFAIPYNAKAKPIERLFATVASQFSKTIPTYCGKDTASRPEELRFKLEQQSIIDSALTFDTLAEKFSAWTEAYNNTVHSGAGMEGKSPAQVLSMRLSKRVISSDVLDMLMCVWSGKLKVGKNGIRFKGLLYGQYEPRILQQFGKIVRVSYNPADLRTITVYDSESLQRLCIAEQNQLVKYGSPVGEESLREAMQEKAGILRAHRNWNEKQGLQHYDLIDLTIKAKNDANAHEAHEDVKKINPTLRPVKTPLDLQVSEHLREKKRRILRKAAGAENTKIIDIDLSELTRPEKPARERLKLFEK